VQVQWDIRVRDQPGPGRTGQQLVEQGGDLALVFSRAEHRGQRVPGLPGVGQVLLADLDQARFVVGEQQRAQLAGRGQQVLLTLVRRGVDQRDRQPGPPGRPEPDIRSHACYGIRHETRYRTAAARPRAARPPGNGSARVYRQRPG
jgi:hypothetical protein